MSLADPGDTPTSSTRIFVFVDGEHLRFVLHNLLGDNFRKNQDFCPPRANWRSFFQALAYSAIPVEQRHTWTDAIQVHWYVIRDLYCKADNRSMNRARTRFEQFKGAQREITKNFPEVSFQRHGSVYYNSHGYQGEKGVDIALAIGMVEFMDDYDIAVLVSRDADFEPVVEHVQKRGKRVANVSFLKEDQSELPGSAVPLVDRVDGSIQISYADMKRFMGY